MLIPSHPVSRRMRQLRWLLLIAASFLLHLLAVNWAGGFLGLPSLREDNPPPVAVTLLPPPPPVVAPKPAPKRRPKPKAKPIKPAPPPPAVPEAAPAPAPVEENPAPPAGMEAPGPGTEIMSEPATADAQDVPGAPPTDNAAKEEPLKFDPPPSAELRYDVSALREGDQWYGSGMFRWESTGARYRITGEASIRILFKITVLSFTSEGVLNGDGVAPALYSETPWRKATSTTRFQRDLHAISFSASSATFPYNGSEQDRASIIWQLASIGRGDAAQFAAGAAFDIVVAGTRDAETWHIDVVGEEEIETGFGRLSAWHVRRSPRAGSRDQAIDIWLSPQQEWYPVKVLYTYANGDHLEMSLSGLERAATQ